MSRLTKRRKKLRKEQKEKEKRSKAFDSELMHQEIFIPEGFEATIDGDKIILKKIESEDEKIRKELIGFLRNNPNGNYTCEEMAAWLEKQETSYTKKDVDNAYVEGMAFAKDELEKQGEKKSSDEVLKIRQELYQSGYNDGYKHGCEDTKKQGEQKPAWGKEDEEMFEYTINLLNYNLGCRKWLQSLKERHIWKPSDEQMKALNATAGIVGILTPTGVTLCSLYHDLEKLKGE